MKQKFRKSILLSSIAIATISFVTATSLFLVACTNNKIIIPARENVSNGLTTIDNDQEKYINQNSASILFYSTPNIQYLSTYLSKYLEDNVEHKPSESDTPSKDSGVTVDEQNQINAYIVTQTLNKILINGTNGSDYQVSNLLLGTTWLLDYSLVQNSNVDGDEATKNLATYYFATNMHVLNVAYSIAISTTQNNVKYDLELNVPVSSVSTTNLDVFLSQPQGGVDVDGLGQKIPNNLTIPANNSSLLSTAWYKTPLTKDTFESSIIPGGSTLSAIKSYDLTATLTTTDNSNGVKNTQSYYYYSDNEKNLSSVDVVDKASERVSDFSIIKITDSANNITLPNESSRYYNSFLGLKTMLTIDTSKTNVMSSSSYLTKLNYLNDLAANQSSNRSIIDELFLFRDYSSLNSRTILSVAGYPSTSQTSGLISANFNSNTISYSLSTYTGESNTITGYARPSIQYSLNGKFYFSSYNWQDNLLMPNVNLMPGSSGSMVIDNDYKLVGIYWGIVTSGTDVFGVANTLFSKNSSKSLIAKYLNYIKNIDKNSELLKLFRNLNINFSYFN